MLQVSARATTVDDIFYPADPVRLAEEVRRLLDASPVEPHAPLAVVAPHAALEYAGSCIAAAMKASADRSLRRVVVLAPIHRDPPEGFVLPESSVFQCPLGDLEVDGESVEGLLACGTVFRRNDIPHLEEHSVEALLPFVRYLHPEALLVPILTGRTGKKAAIALARALETCFGADLDGTLLVVSSNAAVCTTRAGSAAAEADRLLELVDGGRWEDILTLANRGRLSCCGAPGLASVLAFAHSALESRVLARSSSPEDSGGQTVEYAAISLRPRG